MTPQTDHAAATLDNRAAGDVMSDVTKQESRDDLDDVTTDDITLNAREDGAESDVHCKDVIQR